MSVHYKFKSATSSETVKFDGVHISVADLKAAICQQKRLGKGRDSELQIRDAETMELYAEDSTLIPKNTSLIVQRVPNPHYSKHARGGGADDGLAYDPFSGAGLPNPLSFRGDLAGDNPEASEEDKIRAMMIQSTQDYDPSRYVRIRGASQYGPVPHGYVCHRCKRRGHWIRNCPFPDGETKRSTGIPSSFLKKVEGPNVPGAMLTPSGEYAIMKTADEAYKTKRKKDPPPFALPDAEGSGAGKQQKENREPSLLCPVCDDYAKDAVRVPCCRQLYCDDCIRLKLIEEQICPNCNAIDLPPTCLEPATDERLRIRLILANADGKLNEEELKAIGAVVESESAVVAQAAASPEDDDIQEVTPPRRKRRRRQPISVVPGEVVDLDDDDGDAGDDVVVIEDVVNPASLPGPSSGLEQKRARRRKRKSISRAADGEVIAEEIVL